MSTITIEVQDQDVRSTLNRLADKANNMQPMLQALGDDIVERSKRRFETSTGPDGVKWAANSDMTLGVLRAGLGKSYRKKNGDLNAAGERRIAGKKPLIGASGDLRRQIIAVATSSQATVMATPVYAAMHQFGGVTSPRSMIPGKKIPARPFLPITQGGDLYPEEKALVLQAVNDYLMDI